jgi:16S rRNA C967 or C1407 C5-methylase (RsmB/RsmF family)/NOL1/NOP2/fmu family ribosome biogenesis protein
MPKLPQQLLNSLASLSQFDEKAFIEAHQEENKISSIRLNPFKELVLDFKLDKPVAWNSCGFYLEQRPSFTHDPLFQAGCYYVQEAGSMFLEFALKHTLTFSQKLKVLDVCASPGGKSTLINSLLNEESLLIANEIVKSRVDVLVQNLSKWGTCNTVVTNNDPNRFSDLHSFFDAIVIDAPCSGSGLFRKQPDAINEWSEAHVKACGIRQQKILNDIIPCLKENGILFYSTCSYSVQENEDIVNWLINEFQMEYVPLPIDKGWGVVETESGYRFYPHLTQSEGFFCAVLRKKNSSSEYYLPKKKNSYDASNAERATIEPFVSFQDRELIKKNDQFHLVNKEAATFLNVFEKHFYFKKAGVVVGEIKGRDMVPNQELAWFKGINNMIKKVEVDKETALKFLKRETFLLPEKEKGLVLITYKKQGLGWAKILPNRVNNYLPNELRILK